MGKLSKIMKASLFTATVTATAGAHAEEQSCIETYTSEYDRGMCLLQETEKLARVQTNDATYFVERAHEIIAYDPIHGKHLGTLNLHWGSVQDEYSESYGNIAERPDYAQENFAQAIQDTCQSINENLNISGDLMNADIEAYGEQYPYNDMHDYANRQIRTLERFTTHYCPQFE
jgi:hypothetical protein